MRDPEVVRFLEARFAEQTQESIGNFIEKANASRHTWLVGIFVDGGHVGNVKLAVDPHHNRADIGILIGEKKYWGQGIARRAIALICDYAFSELGIFKLNAGCYETNLASRKTFEAAGFEIECVRASQFVDQDKRVAGLYLTRFRPGAERPA